MTATGATSAPPVNVSERKEIARLLLDSGTEAIDLELEPVIDRTFPLNGAPEAIRYVGERSTQGKTVITV